MLDYPNNYQYWHSGNFTPPGSATVGLSDVQTLSNKTILSPLITGLGPTLASGTVDLGAPTYGSWRFYKAWGGNITFTATGASGLIGPSSQAFVSSFLLQAGGTAAWYADGTFWVNVGGGSVNTRMAQVLFGSVAGGGTEADKVVTFTTALPVTPTSIVLTQARVGTDTMQINLAVVVGTESSTGFTAHCRNNAGGSSNISFYYIALL